MIIRPAEAARDAASCAAIYAPYVTDTVISFEAEPPDAAEMGRRMNAAIEWLVAREDDVVLGYAYATRHRERAAYRFACDVSVYTAPAAHRRGVGTALYGELLARVTARGLRMACAGVTQPNPASVGFHEAMGFQRVGLYRAIGWKFGAWHDVLWLQRPLAGDGPPEREPNLTAPSAG
ncbi:N-acetyltransferase [Calidifontibacter sp. DB0510]|uniref:N-acetyltransferase n=1 Tax=Metallococcus carri TaxID=1656884 RepID=A0A967EBQ0_9MICO|nr:GNAT family N-acetyltransferase [Metallococcus carri]NHN57199.1 N-acetyltransferase [Metallococcus carri]NOP37998.1 N-acetyltransferase [Calidifontibacter sp. DB2511S]